jgi:hypothetical protein
MPIFMGILEPNINIAGEPLISMKISRIAADHDISYFLVLQSCPKFQYFLVKDIHGNYLLI